jgi:murein DD-endopeptidase MepM/ murein hydrolase activator NlpD
MKFLGFLSKSRDLPIAEDRAELPFFEPKFRPQNFVAVRSGAVRPAPSMRVSMTLFFQPRYTSTGFRMMSNMPRYTPFGINLPSQKNQQSIFQNHLAQNAVIEKGRLEGALKWEKEIKAAAEKHNVPWELLAAIVAVESGGNPEAVSVSGAIGLAQVMPQYHSQRAAKYGGNLADPQTNLMVAAEILAENYQRYGSWDKAVAAYFGAIDAQGNITGAKDAYGTSGFQYVSQVITYWNQLKGVSPTAGSLWTITGGKEYPITQEFGETEFAKTSGYYANKSHPSIDLGVPLGTPLYAPVSGVIEVAGSYGGYGNAVGIRTADGYFILLGHLDSVSVSPGQQVQVGAFIGKSGNTGASTGPHLHIEVRTPDGRIIDPRTYFSLKQNNYAAPGGAQRAM